MKERVRTLRGMVTIVRAAFGVSVPLTVIAVLLAVVTAALIPAALAAAGLVVTAATARDSRAFVPALILLAVANAGMQLLPPVREIVVGILTRRIDTAVNSRVMAAALRPAGVGHLEHADVLNEVSVAMGLGSGGYTPGVAFQGFIQLVNMRLSTLGTALVVVRFQWWLGAALLLGGFALKSFMKEPFRKAVTELIENAGPMRRSGYYRDLAVTPRAAKEVRLFGMAPWLVERFRGHWLEAMSQVWKVRKEGSRGLLRLVPLVFIAYAGALVYVGWAALHGRLDIGAMAVTAQAVLRTMQVDYGSVDQQIEHGAAAIPALRTLEELPAEVPGAVDPAGSPRDVLRFEGMSFTYPGRDEPVFSGLDLEVPAGKSLAIVGRNGAGKTTLMKLLARLYEPTDGRITADGVDIRSFEPHAWQRRVAAIFQDFIRYELPASDNVGFGAIERLADRDVLRDAAHRAGALELIEDVGWGTVLARNFTGGADLSGGQWQRIGLSRAMVAVAGGAGILILDEPTAALDARSEVELFDRFFEITRGVTSIVISHRFSTVRRADHIVVLEHGRVVEHGTHDDLLAAGGVYAEMFILQAARFSADVE